MSRQFITFRPPTPLLCAHARLPLCVEFCNYIWSHNLNVACGKMLLVCPLVDSILNYNLVCYEICYVIGVFHGKSHFHPNHALSTLVLQERVVDKWVFFCYCKERNSLSCRMFVVAISTYVLRIMTQPVGTSHVQRGSAVWKFTSSSPCEECANRMRSHRKDDGSNKSWDEQQRGWK